MNLIPIEWYYPLCVLLMWGLVFIFIPRDKRKVLFWYGIIWGFLTGYIFGWLFGLTLHLYEYKLLGPFRALGANLWLNFAWIPAIMVYLYNLPESNLWYIFPLYLLTFSLASASLDEVFHGAGLLRYYYWNSLIRFIIAFFWFWGVKIHYTKTKDRFKI